MIGDNELQCWNALLACEYKASHFIDREALPKAKEQPADTAHSSPSNSAPSQTTAAAASASDRPHEDRPSPRGGIALLRGVPAPVGGARRISAELPVPEDGGLFHGGPLTNRKKDTGGVGEHPACTFNGSPGIREGGMPAERAPELRGRAASHVNFMQQQCNDPPVPRAQNDHKSVVMKDMQSLMMTCELDTAVGHGNVIVLQTSPSQGTNFCCSKCTHQSGGAHPGSLVGCAGHGTCMETSRLRRAQC